MIPEFPEFKKIELSDQAFIRNFTKEHPPYSDFNFTSLFCWDIRNQRSISILDGNLVVKFTDDVTSESFFSLLGHSNVQEAVNKLLLFSKSEGLKTLLKIVPQQVVSQCLDGKYSFDAKEDRNNFDYIYSIEELTAYSGSRFAQARNLYNRFLNRHKNRIDVRQFDLRMPQDREYFTLLLRKWDGIREKYIENEAIAINRLLQNIDHFDLVNIMVFVDGEPVAASVNEVIDQKYAISHFAKADYRYPGVYSFLLKSTAEQLKGYNCDFLNYEEDLGLAGLRQAKESYRPVNFLKKYTVRKNSPLSYISKMLSYFYGRKTKNDA